jgi:hypothetical protein
MTETEAKLEARRERYLRDPLPVRLGNLASNLARVRSFSNHATMGEAAGKVFDESRLFIEWTIEDADPSQQAELNELRELISRWRMELTEIWNDAERRNNVAAQAAAWSQKILESSGLLNSR